MSTNPSGPDRILAAPASSAAASVTSSVGTSLQGKADPEALLSQIRRLVTDDLVAARRLAAQAVARFPGHEGLRNAQRILAEGEASRSLRGREPDRRADLKWLMNPPESVRGLWVGLVGGELVGASESLAELVEGLRDRGLAEKALVHLVE